LDRHREPYLAEGATHDQAHWNIGSDFYGGWYLAGRLENSGDQSWHGSSIRNRHPDST